jgi:sugar (pentulose or hexulose) kinase
MASPDRQPRRVETVLALDLGSTNLKAALFHAVNGCLAEGSVPVAYLTNESTSAGFSHVTLNPEGVWLSIARLISETCASADAQPSAIDRIAVASQAQTFVLLDTDGVPLTPFISWLDTRGAPYSGEIADALGDHFHDHCSFSSGMSELALSKLLLLRDQNPELLSSTARVELLPSYIVGRLVGLAITDANLAAMSGLYSLHLQTWWDAALELCGLAAEQLPELAPLGAPLRARQVCSDLGLRGDVEVVLAGNDQTAGAYGNGCAEGDWVITLGTALVAYRYAGQTPGPYGRLGCWGPYPGGGYYELGVRNHGCLALDWAREQIMPGEPIEAFIAEAAKATRVTKAPTCGSTACFYPAHMGTANAWDGLADSAQRALAVLEGIGLSLRQLILSDLEVVAPPTSIVAIGGGARSDLWLQLLADILGCPVRRGTGDARTGAAMMAITDAPAFRLPAYPDADRAQPIFHPTPRRVEYYEWLYESWRKRFPRCGV